MDIEGLREAIGAGRVEIRRSKRRSKTIGSLLEGETIVLVLPWRYPVRGNEAQLASLITRLERKIGSVRAGALDLEERCRELTARYFADDVLPASVRWVGNQHTLWGSTTSVTREIRISDRLRFAPPWVLDAVLVHELAHLRILDHGPRFKELVAAYPRYDRAQDFLAGFAAGQEWSRSARTA